MTWPLQLFRIKAVKKGIKRAHVEAGNQTWARRPLAWEMIKVMEESIDRGVGWVGEDSVDRLGIVVPAV